MFWALRAFSAEISIEQWLTCIDLSGSGISKIQVRFDENQPALIKVLTETRSNGSSSIYVSIQEGLTRNITLPPLNGFNYRLYFYHGQWQVLESTMLGIERYSVNCIAGAKF